MPLNQRQSWFVRFVAELKRRNVFRTAALSIDGDNPDTLYNFACCFALMGESDRALDCPRLANLRGMAIAEWAENDSDLVSLHDDPRFKELMQSFKGRRSPASDKNA